MSLILASCATPRPASIANREWISARGDASGSPARRSARSPALRVIRRAGERPAYAQSTTTGACTPEQRLGGRLRRRAESGSLRRTLFVSTECLGRHSQKYARADQARGDPLRLVKEKVRRVFPACSWQNHFFRESSLPSRKEDHCTRWSPCRRYRPQGRPTPPWPRKHSRQSLLNVDTSSFFPVISRRIPNRESTIGMCVDHQSGVPRPAGFSKPALLAQDVPALVLHRFGFCRHSKLDARRFLDVRRPRWVTRGQLLIQVLGPLSRECPPRHVEQKALPSPLSPVSRLSRGASSISISGAGPTFFRRR